MSRKIGKKPLKFKCKECGKEQQQLGCTPYLVIDDVHLLFQWLSDDIQRANFLFAVAQFGDEIHLTVYTPEAEQTLTGYNFSTLNVDFYALPQDQNRTLLWQLEKQVGSMGIYLWVWDGSGLNWQTITPYQITGTYQTAIQLRASSFFVWMGEEPNIHEQGMTLSSLYNYPQRWSLITQLNYRFFMHGDFRRMFI